MRRKGSSVKKNAGIPYFLRDRGVLAPTEIRLNK
jgi:hypothetical protein